MQHLQLETISTSSLLLRMHYSEALRTRQRCAVCDTMRSVLCGTVQAASALGLPGPRQSVGVEVEGNAYSVLLPHSVCAPCSATQVFTTVHDGQAQVRS